MNKHDEWWASITIQQKERIALKLIKKLGLIDADSHYPHCTNIWMSLPEEKKAFIHKHCTDDHGLVLKDWSEGLMMSE